MPTIVTDKMHEIADRLLQTFSDTTGVEISQNTNNAKNDNPYAGLDSCQCNYCGNTYYWSPKKEEYPPCPNCGM